MNRVLPFLVLLLALLGGFLGAQTSDQGIPDRELGLSKASVFDTPAPSAVHENESVPGDLPVMARMFQGAPPSIPHGVADFLPITPSQNLCIDCHFVEPDDLDEVAEGDPTPLPISHLTDLRNPAEKSGEEGEDEEDDEEEVVGARWICVTCHVATTDAAPLVP